MSSDEVPPGATPAPVPPGQGLSAVPPPGPPVPPAPAGSWDLDVAAASLRMDTGDTDQLFQALGQKLERILGQRVQVQRGGGLFKRDRVDKINVLAGETGLEAVRGRTGPVFRATHTVRGIVLQTVEIPADEWLERLVSLVSSEAARSNDVRSALGRLLD